MRNEQILGQEQTDALDRSLTSLYQREAPEGFHTGWRAAIRREENIQMKGKRMPRFWKVALPSAAALVLVLGSLLGEYGHYAPDGSGNEYFPIMENQVARQSLGMQFVDEEFVFLADDAAPMASMPEADWDDRISKESADASFGGAPANAPAPAQERKIIRTASLSLATIAFEQAEGTLRARITEMGGYVENLYQYGDGSENSPRCLTITARIPADKLDAFLAGAEALGRVTYKGESATDVTVEYTDTSLRLATQRAKLERLQELLLGAAEVSDLLEIESEIANTQYRIDAYETSLRGIDRNVAHSTVSVTLQEETPAESAAAMAVTLGDRLAGALRASLKGIAQFFENMLVFVVWAAPVAIGITGVGIVIWLIARTRRKGGREKKESHQEGEA